MEWDFAYREEEAQWRARDFGDDFGREEREEVRAPRPGRDEPDYYAMLNVDRDASVAEIRESYRRLAAILHPDKHPPERREAASRQFQELNTAYEVLTDETKRQIYDTLGVRGLESGWTIGHPLRTAQEVREAFERYERERQGLVEEARHPDTTTLNIGVDTRRVFRTLLREEAFEPTLDEEDEDAYDDSEDGVEDEDESETYDVDEDGKEGEDEKRSLIERDSPSSRLGILQKLVKVNRVVLSHATTIALTDRLRAKVSAAGGARRRDPGLASILQLSLLYHIPSGIISVGTGLFRSMRPWITILYDIPAKYVRNKPAQVQVTARMIHRRLPPVITVGLDRPHSERWMSTFRFCTGTWALPWWPAVKVPDMALMQDLTGGTVAFGRKKDIVEVVRKINEAKERRNKRRAERRAAEAAAAVGLTLPNSTLGQSESASKERESEREQEHHEKPDEAVEVAIALLDDDEPSISAVAAVVDDPVIKSESPARGDAAAASPQTHSEKSEGADTYELGYQGEDEEQLVVAVDDDEYEDDEPVVLAVPLSRSSYLATLLRVPANPVEFSWTIRSTRTPGAPHRRESAYTITIANGIPRVGAEWGNSFSARSVIRRLFSIDSSKVQARRDDTEEEGEEVQDDEDQPRSLVSDKVSWKVGCTASLLRGVSASAALNGKIGKASWGLGLDYVPNGVWLKIRIGTTRQKVVVPVWLIDEPDVVFALSTATMIASTVLGCFTGWELWLLREKRRRIKELQEARDRELAEKKREREEVLEILKDVVKRSASADESPNRLTILEALYGPGHMVESGTTAGALDVTIPVQALVSDGRLHIPGGPSKSHLLGFYDAFPGEKKCLRIRYQQGGQEYVVIVGDREELSAPSESHAAPL